MWMHVANSALKRCLADGGKESDCAGKAVRQANGVAGKMGESATLEEAATLKSQAQQLLHQLKSILARKDLAPEVHQRIQATLTDLQKRWSDLAPSDAVAASESAGDGAVADLQANDVLEAAADVLSMADSFDGIRTAVQQALRMRAMQVSIDAGGATYDYPSCWIVDLFPDTVVYCEGGDSYYRSDYTIDADDTVTLGDPVEVERAWVTLGEALAEPPESPGVEPILEPGPDDDSPEVEEAKADPNVGGGTDRTKIPAADFAGKSRSFPIVTPKDVADAAASIGRAGAGNYSTDELKRRIIAIAKRKGAAFVAQLPNAWKEADAGVELTGDLVPLVERALRPDSTVRVKLIQPGQGSSGFYPAEVLKRDGPKVFTKGLHMYADHATPAEEAERPEGSIRDLMSVLETDAWWEDQGADGPGLYADAKVMPHFADHLEALAPHIGVSIRALGTFDEDGKSVAQLVAAKSADYVTRAGAGGKVLELFEAARGAAPTTEAQPSRADTPPSERSHTAMDETEAKALREAYDARTRDLEERDNRIKQLEEAMLMRQVKDLVDAELATIEMPDMTRKRLSEALAQRPKLKDDGTIDVDGFRAHIRESVTAELRYLAEATGLGSGKIVGMGVSSLEEAEGQRAAESLEKSFIRMGMTPESAKVAAAGRRG